MSEEQWMPSDYCEETSPTPRASPTAWIIEDDDGRPCLAGEYGDEPAFALDEGREVRFLRLHDHGGAVIVFNPDGTASLSAPMPAEAEQCCVMDGLQADTLAGDTDELLTLLRDAAEPGPGDEFRAAYYTFEGPLPFRFDAATRSFVQVAS